MSTGSRYELLLKIAAGGMATVYLGRQKGQLGFWRLVAIKRAHPHLTGDPKFIQMTLDEAMLASRIRHPNVVSVLDVDRYEDELLLVLDYIEGASLLELVDRAKPGRLPPEIAIRVILDACNGLHAAHELKDERGASLGLVHRDVSPHNILVGVDGASRLTDFGIAKFAKADKATSVGVLKGKIRYMAPEYINAGTIDRRGDVFSMGVTLWGALTGVGLFEGENPLEILRSIAEGRRSTFGDVAPELPAEFEDVFQMALAVDPSQRFASVLAFSNALSNVASKHGLSVGTDVVARHVEAVFGRVLAERRAEVQKKLDPEDPLLATFDDAFKLPGASEPSSGPKPAARVPSIAPGSGAMELSDSAVGASTGPTRSRKRRSMPVWPFALAAIAGGGLAAALVLAQRPSKTPSQASSVAPSASAVAPSPSVPTIAPTVAPRPLDAPSSSASSVPSSVPRTPFVRFDATSTAVPAKPRPTQDKNNTIDPNPFGTPTRL